MANWETGEIKMKKFIVLAVVVGALGVLATRPQADVSRQASAEPLAMLALMPVPKSLPIEAYEAI